MPSYPRPIWSDIIGTRQSEKETLTPTIGEKERERSRDAERRGTRGKEEEGEDG